MDPDKIVAALRKCAANNSALFVWEVEAIEEAADYIHVVHEEAKESVKKYMERP